MSTDTPAQPLDLQAFCADEHEIRAGLRRPFRIGDWVYATNGHLIVRAPAVSHPDVKDRDSLQPNNPPKMFKTFFDEREGNFIALPPLPDVQPCITCDGTGEIEGDECGVCVGAGCVWTYYAMGDCGYALHYLRLLNALPQLRIRPQGPNDAAALIFDGGQALLMPMRERKAA